jgi:quercetin dioxygenase-like cupin family protein
MSQTSEAGSLGSSPESLAGLVAYQPGSVVSRVLCKAESGNVTVFAFSAGEELSPHSTPFAAVLQVVEGEAVVTIADKAHRMRGGEIILLPRNINHGIQAATNFKMLLVMLQ